MKYHKILYQHLTSKQKEIFNFQKVSGILADYGFNCIKLADDWQGADFLAYHNDKFDTLKVQLKSRLSIHKKYMNKGLYIIFPNKDHWYLVEHDVLVEKIGEITNYLESDSWTVNSYYHNEAPRIGLMESLSNCKL